MSQKIHIGRNDACHCGSGKKYKHCHMQMDKVSGTKVFKLISPPPSTLAELQRNTLEFIENIRELLGISFDSKSGAGAILGEVTKQKVRTIFQLALRYFPPETDLRRIFHGVSAGRMAGVYWGSPNFNSISDYIARYALYTSKIVVTNPFCDIMMLHPEISPLQQPEKWFQVCMNQALFLVSLEQWIRDDVIIVLPPLSWCDPTFLQKIAPIALARLNSYPNEMQRRLEMSSVIEMVKDFPPEDIEHLLKASFRNVPHSALESAKALAQIALLR